MNTQSLSHRDVLILAGPIILSNVTTPLVGLVDTAVLGQLGPAHLLGAVALASTLFSLLYWAFGFLRMGTTGLTAQASGAENRSEVTATLARSLLIAIGCGVALIVLQRPISWAAFSLLEGSVSVEFEARHYFDIRIWSAPAALANYALLGWFIGLGRAGTAFALQILLNGTNAALDVLFVMGFGWEVGGVALGTLLAELLAAGVGLAIAFTDVKHRYAGTSWAYVLEASGLRRIAGVNRDIMIRTLCVLFAFTFFMAQGAKAGDITLAANAVLLHFLSVSAYFLDGFAFAAERLVGHSIGSGIGARFRRAVWLTTFWAFAFSAVMSVLFWLFGPFIIDLLTVNNEVRHAARLYLPWMALVPILGFACFQLDGIFIGATRTADMRNMMLLSFIAYLVAWAVLTPQFGNHGLWMALLIFFAARAITLGFKYPALERDVLAAPAKRPPRSAEQQNL